MRSLVRDVGRFLLHPWTRYVLAWCVALVSSAIGLYTAWHDFDVPARADKNQGHCMIDFGGQWLMGRMLQEGHARHLYVRQVEREVLRAAYPTEDQDPSEQVNDADRLIGWMMGQDSDQPPEDFEAWNPSGPKMGIGGPLYPPINAFVYFPLAWANPSVAYRLNQILNLLLSFTAGLAARQLSRGRVWWPVTTTFIQFFPGFGGSMALAQNSTLSLNLLMWGWLLVARDRPSAGGAVWGLLAFKPVWAAAFFLAPLLTRRWRVCFAMLTMGTLLALSTLPFVGLHSWQHWLQVGHDAAVLYDTDENWIHLSKDLLSIPRRTLVDFTAEGEARDAHSLQARLIGWGLVLFVLEVTVRMVNVWHKRAERALDGPIAGFLQLCCWMMCFHFIYYDLLLAAFPVFLLLTEPRKFLEPRFVVIQPLSVTRLGGEVAGYYQLVLPSAYPSRLSLPAAGLRHLWLINRTELNLVALLLSIVYLAPLLGGSIYHGWPWETFCLIALWFWCGWLWYGEMRMEREESKLDASRLAPKQGFQLPADVCRPHKTLADQDGSNPSLL
jgi:hypothetical protein